MRVGARVMQAANAAAPKLLDAIMTLGRALDSHVSFALLGLPIELQTATQDAIRKLRPVSARLVSRKIASSLRVEMASLRAASAHPCLTLAADWTVLPGDVLPLLIESSSCRVKGPVVPSWRCAPRSLAQYQFATNFAQICRVWSTAACQWRSQPCILSLLRPSEREVRTLVRLSPNAVELQLHGGTLDRSGVVVNTSPIFEPRDARGGTAGLWLALASEPPMMQLERLLIRVGEVAIASLEALLDSGWAPKLRELEIQVTTGVNIDDSFDRLYNALAARPHLRLTVPACDAFSMAFLEDETIGSQLNCFDCHDYWNTPRTDGRPCMVCRAGQPSPPEKPACHGRPLWASW